ncbi:MAG TPA: ribosome small subunit-dependent GTPase A [Candidatus Dormibacteraeota bacterium]|nr:ribosome small subunit-dependent GTPase A [Candidatus Dormibacteraeota bacterium]
MRVDELRRSLVVSTGRNSAWVALDEERVARMAQLRRMRGRRSMPVPGDVAFVRLLEDGSTVVERIEPRSSALTRRTVAGRSKTIAANVDTLVAVAALAQPSPRAPVLDRLVAFAELEGIAAVMVLTKPDLAAPERTAHWRQLYAKLGYATAVVDPKHGTHVEELRALLCARASLLCGVSGVGKSSIFRALGGEAVVGDLSRHGIGRQTTTSARLCRFEHGFLIDSPGIAEFGLGAIAPRELASAFVEMPPFAEHCRFTDCTHLTEPGCAVRAAVASGEIDAGRYASYLQILRAPSGHAMVQ